MILLLNGKLFLDSVNAKLCLQAPTALSYVKFYMKYSKFLLFYHFLGGGGGKGDGGGGYYRNFTVGH